MVVWLYKEVTPALDGFDPQELVGSVAVVTRLGEQTWQRWAWVDEHDDAVTGAVALICTVLWMEDERTWSVNIMLDGRIRRVTLFNWQMERLKKCVIK